MKMFFPFISAHNPKNPKNILNAIKFSLINVITVNKTNGFMILTLAIHNRINHELSKEL